MARLSKEELGDMDEEGDRVKARRTRLGMEKGDLATAAGIHRNTLTALENGESFNRSTLLKVLRALDAAEEEAGIGAAEPQSVQTPGDPHMVTIQSKRGDIDVVVSGPIEDIDKLAETVERLLRTSEVRKDQAESDSD